MPKNDVFNLRLEEAYYVLAKARHAIAEARYAMGVT